MRRPVIPKINNIQTAFRHGLVRMRLLERLKKLGLGLEPYYLTKVGNFKDPEPQWESRFSEYETGFVGPEVMKEVASCGEQLPEVLLLDRLERGLSCFAIKHRERIAAYVWCAFEQINDSMYKASLKEKEVHLYNVWTRPEYRGKGIAAFMMYQCVNALEEKGIANFYTLVNYFNTPSLRFHQKINVRFVKLGLQVSIGSKYSWNFLLREFRQP